MLKLIGRPRISHHGWQSRRPELRSLIECLRPGSRTWDSRSRSIRLLPDSRGFSSSASPFQGQFLERPSSPREIDVICTGDGTLSSGACAFGIVLESLLSVFSIASRMMALASVELDVGARSLTGRGKGTRFHRIRDSTNPTALS
jgi:hypothetical protein